MRILITGVCGYIGSVCAPALQRLGFDVVGVDIGWFGLSPGVITADYRSLDAEWLKERGIEGIVHLAAYSNDPSGQLDIEDTLRVNGMGVIALAREAIEAGVRAFVFASSAAVYGGANNRICRESDACNPLTAYAWGKLVAEEGLRQLRSDHPGMAMCVFRQGTVFGLSDNMRFDLAINTMVRAGVTRGTLHVYGPERYRPWLFIEDLPRLYARALSEGWDGLWNAAGSNATLGEVGRLVADVVGCRIVEQSQTEDLRNYGANAGRLQQHLGDWHLCSLREAEKGVHAIAEWIRARSEEEVYSPRWERVEWLRQQRSSAPAAS